MTGGIPGEPQTPERTPPSLQQPLAPSSPRWPPKLSRRQLWGGGVMAIILVAAIVWLVHYYGGRNRRQYDKAMLSTLDRLLTAQEGFFYDSSHYVGSLSALKTVRLAPGVHVEMANPDRHSWWGVATHGLFGGHRCVVWVGSAPASFPAWVRTPENEAKPVCFDEDQVTANPPNGS